MMNLELIKLVNRLQDTFAAANINSPIDLPQIVVIGSQSSGKSSVLEHIVGRDFLPRGSGIVTRRPLILQLINRPGRRPSTDNSGASVNSIKSPQTDAAGVEDEIEHQFERKASIKDSKGTLSICNCIGVDGEEWGEFLHKPGKKYFNFEEIRDEIVQETDRATGGASAKGISPEPINLRIYSPHVLTLTLVDLPGLTKVPVGDQPKDIERQIRDMIMRYIVKPNAIILAVTSANTDIANSDGLKLARDVDPDGIRTVGVLTKVDIMDKGTDVTDILTGRVIPLRLGYVPVVLRGQRDIENKKSIRDALETERDFFQNHAVYSANAKFTGTPFLSKKLSQLLLHNIKLWLPDIKQKINALLVKYQSELASLGDIPEGSFQSLILSIINEFSTDFRNILDGYSQEISMNELNGGARISFVFYEIFSRSISTMDPFDQINDSDIRTLLYNSSGSTPAIFVATSAFEVLAKQQIRRLEDPGLKCVSLVYDELVRILTQLLNKPVFKRFPQLKEKFYSTVLAFIKKGVDPTNDLVKKLVQAETYFINTAHPNFISGHKAMAIIYERMHPKDKIDSKKPMTMNSPSTVPSTGGPSGVSGQSEEAGIFSSFFGGKKPTRKPGILEPPPAVLKASGSVSQKESEEIEVIKLLLSSYFDIVKQTCADLVPKYIMANLVKYARDELQQGMLSELYREDILNELLKENPETVSRRSEVRKMIFALQKADEIVSTI